MRSSRGTSVLASRTRMRLPLHATFPNPLHSQANCILSTGASRLVIRLHATKYKMRRSERLRFVASLFGFLKCNVAPWLFHPSDLYPLIALVRGKVLKSTDPKMLRDQFCLLDDV